MKHITFILASIMLTNVWGQTTPTPQEKAELVIRKHLKKAYKKYDYKGYMFGELIKITPSEIIEFEEYRKAIASIDNSNDSLATYYDSILKEKLKTIKQKKLYSTYELNHFYTIKKPFKEPVLFEYTFTLFPNGKIKNASENFEYKFIDKEYDYFYHYYRKSSLYNNSEANNKSTYDYLNSLYENETIDKKAALSTILTVTKVIYDYNAYDTSLISKIEAKKWLNKNLNKVTINNYSDLKPIIDTINNKVFGYKLFAKITHNKIIKTYYFEFDYNYILRGVLPVEKDDTKYFLKKK